MAGSVIPAEDLCACGVYRKTECERGCIERTPAWLFTAKARGDAIIKAAERRCLQEEKR